MRERGERHRVPPALRAGLAACLLALAGPPADAQQLPFNRYTADDGLAATQVWDVLQDRRGYLWAATTWGLCRWDGERFTTLSVPEGLPSPNTRSLLEDEIGRLWIGTNNGLAVFDGRRIEVPADLGGLPRSAVWAAERDGAGRLWFGTESGLLLHDGRGFRGYGPEAGLPDRYVYALHAARDGALWVGTRGAGAARCELAADGGLGACRSFGAEALGHGVVRAIVEDERGRIFLATRGAGVAVYESGRFTHLGAADGLPSEDVYALLVDSADELLVGTADAGIAVCPLSALGDCRSWREANGLPDDGVRVLAEDHEKAIWIGTEGGLASIARRDIWSYGEAEGLPDAQVYALAADPAGGLWVGTFHGLAELRLGPAGEPKVAAYRRAQGLPADWVWALAAPRAGEVWVGTEEGLCRMGEGSAVCRETYRRAQGLPSDYIYGLYLDRAGDLWIGTTNGLARLRGATAPGPRPVEAYSTSDGLAANRSYAMLEDGEGRLWIAHGEGLSWWTGARFRAVDPSPGLPIPAVRSLGVDRHGRLWVGGFGHVTRLVEMGKGGPRFERFPVAAEGEAALVLAISEDAHGHLLLGTNRGVLVFDPAAQGGRGETVARFHRDGGQIATEVSHSSAFARDRTGRTWFGFKGGLTGFPPGVEETLPRGPMLAIERLESTRGQVYSAPFSAAESGARTLWLGRDAPRFPPGDRSLRITARALTLQREGGVRYQFRLDGLDEDWPPPQTEAFRDFTNLGPGRHLVRARTAVGEGSWGPPIEIAFEIRPTLWQTPLARIGGALAALGLLAAVVAWRTSAVERRTRELERQVADRTDDLARYARALAEHLSALDRGNQLVRETDRQRRDLLAQLSHEVRTPLTSILGFSELLESAAAPRLTARELRYLANVRESGNHLLRLVNNLLDQAKLDAGRMQVHREQVDLAAMVASVVSLMEGFAVVREVRLEARPEGGLPAVEVDLAKLRQVLLNLLSNAIKFSPAGGVVAVEARGVEAGANPLGVPAFELAVRDTGPGIRAEDLPAIFEPFRRLDERSEGQPGTGLGLPIARQLTRLMGGDLEVDSVVGKGSVFRVLLPRTATARPPETGPAERESGDRPRVLIVEPDRAGFGELARDLELGGFLAVRAPDVEEARRMVPELRPVAVALDLDPARPEGWRAAAGLERELVRTRAPLVLVARTLAGRQGWALGFDRVLPANVDVGELVDAVAAFTGQTPPAGGQGGVLLVGGATAAAERRRRGLADAGFEAIVAADAFAARSAFARDRPRAVVVDAAEPLAGGFALLRSVQADRRDGALAWILIAPEELSAPVRRLYTAEVESAPEPAGAALATAVADAAERRARRARGAAAPEG